MEGDPPREALGALPEQSGRRAAEDEEARGRPRAIGEDPEDGEQVGPALHLVQHDQPAQRREAEHRALEAREIARVLEVEVGRAAARLPGELARERALARLPGADEPDHAELPEQRRHVREVPGARDHPPEATRYSGAGLRDFVVPPDPRPGARAPYPPSRRPLQPEHRRPPREARAEDGRHDEVAALHLAELAVVVDRQRYAGRGGVAVDLDAVEHLVGRDLGVLGDGLVDAEVGLVGDEPRDVVPRKPVAVSAARVARFMARTAFRKTALPFICGYFWRWHPSRLASYQT